MVDPGRTVQLNVSSGRPISRVTFVATGSVTHGWNMGQRFVELPFNAQGSTLSVQIVARAADLPPGTWMMFVFDDAGVPSVAKMVRVNVASTPNTAVTPVLTAPGNQSTISGTPVDLALVASDPNGDPLTFSASGLPAGLSINASSGRITGVPTSTGNHSVTVAVSDGFNGTSNSFSWTVSSAGGTLVLNPPPAPAPAVAGSAASFNASATGSGVLYRWDFGDGSAPSAWLASGSASHVYTSAGIYYVTVTARDGAGNEQLATVMVRSYLAPSAQAAGGCRARCCSSRAAAPMRGCGWSTPTATRSSVFDSVSRAKLAEIAVGSAPRTVALAGDGTLWVSNSDSASISVISPSHLDRDTHGRAATRLAALRHRHGTRQRQRAGHARSQRSAAQDQHQHLRHQRHAGHGCQPAPRLGGRRRQHRLRLALHHAAAARRRQRPACKRSAPVPKWWWSTAPRMAIVRTIKLAHSNVPDAENQGRGIPNYLGAAAISPDGTQAFVPSKQDNIARGTLRDGLALNFQNTVRAISSRIDLAAQVEDLPARIDHDNASLASAAVFDPLGVYLFVALETSREVAVLDAHRRNADHAHRRRPRAAGAGGVGRRPHAVRAQLHGPHGRRVRPQPAGAAGDGAGQPAGHAERGGDREAQRHTCSRASSSSTTPATRGWRATAT